uniref:Protein boule-like n=1 Tax=Suricata suricatta TaxID=37032 RepID=A0A673T9Q0_SURSU
GFPPLLLAGLRGKISRWLAFFSLPHFGGEGVDPRVSPQVHDDPREPEEVVAAAISSSASACWPWRGRSLEALTVTQTSNQTQTDSLSPSPNPVSPVPLNNPTSAPRYGTVIPNRIFVGGIDFKTNENDLRKFFSQYGSVKEVKIVNDRAGVSKGYGFVTFETQEDAQKILQEAEKLNYKDKKLNIGPAIRKQQVGIPRSSIMPAAGTMYLTTSTGYPYTYHNGVAYFHTPEVTSVPPPWPSRSVSSSPAMVAQPVYQQPAYHYQAPAQCLPGQWQWGIPQSSASSAPFLYLQPSEVIYQPVEIAQDGGYVPPPLSLMEASVPEPYSDHGVQATYHQVYAPSAITIPTPVMQPEPIKTVWSIHY